MFVSHLRDASLSLPQIAASSSLQTVAWVAFAWAVSAYPVLIYVLARVKPMDLRAMIEMDAL